MNLKILRLTLHSDAHMHGDATKLGGFFATCSNSHVLLHYMRRGRKAAMPE
jgi:hypothetical protein